MSDDLDDLLRLTMKTLDDQVPSGYFDALPERVSARLAGTGADTMQQGISGITTKEAPISAPPAATVPPVQANVAAPASGVPVAARDEDSGLHDIRNLAQSTKQRLSSRRIGTNPPISDDDVLASSSASWKNLALPQPAKMISLPTIDELPSKQEVVARDKAAKAAAKAAARDAKHEPKHDVATPVEPVSASAIEASASAPVEFKPAFSAFAQKKPKAAPSPHRNRNIALVGMGLAAAAGITIFVMTQKNSSTDASEKSAAPGAVAQDRGVNSKDLDLAADKLRAQHAAAAEQPTPAVVGTANGAAPPVDDVKSDTSVVAPAPAKAVGKKVMTKGGKPEVTNHDEPKTKVEATPSATKDVKKGKGEPGDPNFDDLLKEAGVDQKKSEKPKLDKKQLSGDDFKKGMSAIAAKAAACYKGTQGTASVKLTVAPSGQVSKVSVGGQFAGKPEADCVTAAVKSASFPAWDGAPESFGYPILLSE